MEQLLPVLNIAGNDSGSKYVLVNFSCTLDALFNKCKSATDLDGLNTVKQWCKL